MIDFGNHPLAVAHEAADVDSSHQCVLKSIWKDRQVLNAWNSLTASKLSRNHILLKGGETRQHVAPSMIQE